MTNLSEVATNPQSSMAQTTTVSRSYDSQGRITMETVSGDGLTSHSLHNVYDEETQRRESLRVVPGSASDDTADYPRYNYGWHAEGSLKEASFQPASAGC